QMASIQRSLDSTTERPFQLFFDVFYGNHPYALPDAGYATSISTLDAAALREWYRLNVVADSALLIVVGDVNAEDVHAVLESVFGLLPKSSALHPPIPTFVPPPARLEVVEVRDRRQSAIVIGFPTVPPQHPDWIVLRVIQDVASGLAGTFFIELRARRSLAYTVFAGASSRNLAGSFVAYIATDASKEEEAREGLIRECHRIAADGVSAEDLERAKSYIAGSMKIRLQTSSAIGNEIAQNYLHGLGLDFTERFLERIRTITLDELRAIARKYLQHDHYTVAILRGRE
ncbi:MAG TPA: pitrilysin family protein, partial [Thermoanaerobaculia bacterium]